MKKIACLPAGSQGFTIIEMLVVLGILATMLSIGYVSVVGIERRAPIGATVTTVIAELRAQQTKAMTGDTQAGSTPNSYGVYFQSDRYTRFKGTSYNANDTSNAVTILPTNITFSSITFPASSVIFTKGSGDVAGYSQFGSTVTVTQGLTGEHNIITINRYGAVTQIQ